MSGNEAAERNREAAGSLRIAREDIRVARACLALDPPARGVAAYHCQQAAEKIWTNSPTSQFRTTRSART
jgi:hypothetical protein